MRGLLGNENSQLLKALVWLVWLESTRESLLQLLFCLYLAINPTVFNVLSILKAISSHACQCEQSLFRQSYFYIRDAQVKTQVLGAEHVNHEQETLTLDPS